MPTGQALHGLQMSYSFAQVTNSENGDLHAPQPASMTVWNL